MNLKGTKTEKNLLTSFAGESQARNRYTLAAKTAKKDGYAHIAAIFLETAGHEKEHAERFFKFPVVYIEYSGMYGNPEYVKAVSEALKDAQLLYGGGINTKEKAEEMSQWATIVVGNTIYENGTYSFIDTVRGRLLREMSDIQGRLGKLKKLRKKSKNEKPEGVEEKKSRLRVPRFRRKKKSPVDESEEAEKQSS